LPRIVLMGVVFKLIICFLTLNHQVWLDEPAGPTIVMKR